MRQALLSSGIAVFACALAFGQAAENLTFEVASVKPAALPQPGGRSGEDRRTEGQEPLTPDHLAQRHGERPA